MTDPTPDYTAGARVASLAEPESGAPVPLLVTYPARAAEAPTRLGPYEIDLALNADIAGAAHPLVVVSHGSNGSPYTHRRLARHLARRGFVVVAPEHPGDNRNDASRRDTVQNLVARPRLVRAAIDWAYADAALGTTLRDAVGVVGHSMGGYTALAVAGGEPIAMARETPDGVDRPVAVTHDPRVRALVLLAPATPWYRHRGALANVHVPILMLTGTNDAQAPWVHGDWVKRGLPPSTPLTHRVIANATHFAFLSPFPASMRRPGFEPAQDMPGFDRDAFQERLGEEVADWFASQFRSGL